MNSTEVMMCEWVNVRCAGLCVMCVLWMAVHGSVTVSMKAKSSDRRLSYISSDINWWFIRDNYLTYNCNDHFMSYNWLFFIVLCVD